MLNVSHDYSLVGSVYSRRIGVYRRNILGIPVCEDEDDDDKDDDNENF